MTSLLSRPLDIVFFLFFVSHILVTAIFEPTIFFPKEYLPSISFDLLDFYLGTFQDPLFTFRPIWFKSFVFCELTLQLPFFFFACYAILKERNWIRVPGLLYTGHVCTTVVAVS